MRNWCSRFLKATREGVFDLAVFGSDAKHGQITTINSTSHANVIADVTWQ